MNEVIVDTLSHLIENKKLCNKCNLRFQIAGYLEDSKQNIELILYKWFYFNTKYHIVMSNHISNIYFKIIIITDNFIIIFHH